MSGLTAQRIDEDQQCIGRQAHEDPTKALVEVHLLEAELGEPHEVYCCPWCFFWHAGAAANPEDIEAGRERMRRDRIDRHYRHERLNERSREWKRRAKVKPHRRRPPKQG